MTALQRKLLRQSEIRQAINSLLGNDDRTEEQDCRARDADRRRHGYRT